MLDKSHIGLICKSPRASRGVQDTALRAAGAQWVVEIGVTPRTWREAITPVRTGDVVYVYALALIPTKRGQDELTPSLQVADFLMDVRERGAEVVEVLTGRKSGDPKDRRAMVKDANKALRRGSRALPSTGRGRGRPGKEFDADVLAKAKAVWFSRDYETNLIAAKHLPGKMTYKWAWRLFGASGRPFKKRKR